MYKINEIFESLQGEATFTGTPAIFVRLQGCPVGCSWCDTQHTWSVDSNHLVSVNQVVGKLTESEQFAELTPSQLLALFVRQGYQAKHVVITGGEPAMYDLFPLCEMLHQHGFTTQIETSGTFELRVPVDTWVTLSPKIGMKGGYAIINDVIHRANEIKHPVAMDKHIEQLTELLEEHQVTDTPIFLQPISQQARATQLAIKTCIARNWRLSVQLHKYLGIE